MSSVMHRQTVFIVDDDASIRDSLSLLLSLKGYATALFACAEDFMSAVGAHWQGVVVTDIRMPGMSGLDMQAALANHPARIPLIVITAHGDVPAARQALKANALDFLEKPVDEDRLIESIDKALGKNADRPLAIGSRPVSSALSARERQVMHLVVDGMDNRAVGRELEISPRTVEVHKARLMSKLGARNLAELMRIVREMGKSPPMVAPQPPEESRWPS